VKPSDPTEHHSDRVPDNVVARAKAAFGERQPGNLAILVFDSLVDDNDRPEAHRLRFEHPTLTVELRLSIVGDQVSMAGSVTPGASGRVSLRFEDDASLQLLERCKGSFAFGPVRHGLMRLCFQLEGDISVHTDWFRV
jgi:hypothetical protein